MKRLFLLMAITSIICGGCENKKPLKIENDLTPQEIQAAKFTPDIMWKMGRIGSATLSPNGRDLLYIITRYSVSENCGLTSIVLLNLDTKEEQTLTDNSENGTLPTWSADGKTIYYLSDATGENQIWKMNTNGEHKTQISKIDGGVEGFGVAPDQTKLYYLRHTKVADITSADRYKDMPQSKARIYDDLMCRHWNYWDEGNYSHIFVATLTEKGLEQDTDIIGENSAYDAPLAPYFDGDEIRWSADSKYLAYTCKPLTGKEYANSTDSDIFVYNSIDNTTENICKSDKLAHLRFNGEAVNMPEFVGYDKYPVFSCDGNYIAFRSQRRAGNESDKERLFLFDRFGYTMTDLTADFDYNATNVTFADNDTIYFIAPIQATHQICRVSTKGGKVEVITSGDHDINSFTMVGSRCIAEIMSISMAPELFEVNLENGSLTQITNVNKQIYDNIKFGEVQKRWVKTTDGKQMLVWVILPPDFDATKKYPTLLYCQGGPQSVVSQFWSYRWNFQLMAAKGYIVVAPNRRGLPSFGQEWLDQISGDYAGQNIKDYLSAIDDVAKEDWADENRLGCVGASYGGYSVFYLAGHHEGRFKAFIAHCGIFNFESMYGETEELFFLNNDYGGAYWDKNEVATRSYSNSPHKAVDKWDTPILIFTGEKDFRIPYTQSLQAFTAARMHNIPARLVEFENEAHQVFKPQNSIVWNREFFGWLDKYLK